MAAQLINASQSIIAAALTVIAFSCLPSPANAGDIHQDLDKLDTTNGKIISQQILGSASGCDTSLDCYKVRYLSGELEVVGFVIKPKNITHKLPVLIFNRGGNRDDGKIKSVKYLSYLSRNGYIVLASQYRGNDGGQGREEFGGSDVNDVLNLMPLAKSLSFADSNKTVMLGFSRGGMMTLLAIKHGIPIKAAAIVSGATDLEQLYDDREERMKNVIRDLVGTDKNEWRERSAVCWPEKINVPLLILHGSADRRVDVSQAKKLSDKLVEIGKEHKLYIIQNGDHGLNNHRKERNEIIFEWFREHLQNH